MRIVVQRVKEASVKVDGKIVGKTGYGYLLLVSFTAFDNEKIIEDIFSLLIKNNMKQKIAAVK